MKSHIKIFEEKLGPHVPLKAYANLKDIKIMFGQYDTDVAADFTLCLTFSKDEPVRHHDPSASELLYDCLEFSVSSDLGMHYDVVHANIIQLKLVLNSQGNRDRPKRNSMDMTPNEYREFLEDLSFSTSEIKKLLNDVVLRGNNAHMPYTMDEFQTSVKFES